MVPNYLSITAFRCSTSERFISAPVSHGPPSSNRTSRGLLALTAKRKRLIPPSSVLASFSRLLLSPRVTASVPLHFSHLSLPPLFLRLHRSLLPTSRPSPTLRFVHSSLSHLTAILPLPPSPPPGKSIWSGWLVYDVGGCCLPRAALRSFPSPVVAGVPPSARPFPFYVYLTPCPPPLLHLVSSLVPPSIFFRSIDPLRSILSLVERISGRAPSSSPPTAIQRRRTLRD